MTNEKLEEEYLEQKIVTNFHNERHENRDMYIDTEWETLAQNWKDLSFRWQEHAKKCRRNAFTFIEEISKDELKFIEQFSKELEGGSWEDEDGEDVVSTDQVKDFLDAMQMRMYKRLGYAIMKKDEDDD